MVEQYVNSRYNLLSGVKKQVGYITNYIRWNYNPADPEQQNELTFNYTNVGWY